MSVDNRTALIVAGIGLVGAIAAAIISNVGKSPEESQKISATAPPSVSASQSVSGSNNTQIVGGSVTVQIPAPAGPSVSEVELWSMNWELLKAERSKRQSRPCGGGSHLNVMNRNAIIESLQDLRLQSAPEIGSLRDKLVNELTVAQKVDERICPERGEYPHLDFLVTDEFDREWTKLKRSVRSKAAALGLNTAFQFEV